MLKRANEPDRIRKIRYICIRIYESRICNYKKRCEVEQISTPVGLLHGVLDGMIRVSFIGVFRVVKGKINVFVFYRAGRLASNLVSSESRRTQYENRTRKRGKPCVFVRCGIRTPTWVMVMFTITVCTPVNTVVYRNKK